MLEMTAISKRFGDALVNDDVDFNIKPGEIVALLGENGAGKSTLMNVLFGLYRADSGEIRLDGTRLSIRSPVDALGHGIGMVHQHSHVVRRHTVMENLLVGRPGGRWQLADASIRQRLLEIQDEFGLWLDPDVQVSGLSIGEIQRLEILRALIDEVRILILDEPTSVLTPQQVEGLFAAMRAMANRGVGIVMISHKLDEVRALSDRVVIMRRGKVVAELDNDKTLTNAQLSNLMCGRAVEPVRKSPAASPGKTLLALHSQRRGSVTLRANQIVCLAGISGNGQVEITEQMSGVAPVSDGHLEIDGQIVEEPTPKRIRSLGVAYIPEDRQGAGMVGAMTLEQNIVMSRSDSWPFSKWGWLRRKVIRDFASQKIAEYDIRPPRSDLRASLYSGGNQQKCLLARELSVSPRVVVIAYPTRGLDVQASDFVYRKLIELRDNGAAILVVSDDLDEVFTLADRVAVICAGRLTLDCPADETTPEDVGLAMMGSVAQSAASKEGTT
ncbi:MAG TPA: ABC transporter ATP-binding protein [Mesorhizobium sp.]|jgi:simple sugar transport system ATP-binding protein|uniref:ABC transporter ATP-binding protein n=1 Tax=Mesorhizobium sp. TaxID=1871066 RepID=UPI002DDD8EAF|nr:ABC transporter ATP-binding protein [Mesorhizobium sp.]HEV2501815.1 ABC transporter ATP-binding protein [Mesorhizobium sp.]